MRIVGHRIERPISFHASSEALIEGLHFNDEIHRLPTGQITGIPKGVYYFKSHEEANAHQFDCLVAAMVQIRRERQ